MAQLAISLASGALGNAILPGIGGQIGFAVGGILGGVLTQEDLPTQYGPKIEDGRVTSSAYGAMIPKIWGTFSVAGNIIDAGPLLTVQHSSSSGGGKGGPEQKTVTYTQYMTYDVAIADSVDDIVQIYINEILYYDASPAATIVKPSWLHFTLYPGTDTQDPDATFQSIRGTNEVPAYRDTAHVVFWRIKVTDFGTTALNFRFVVTSNATDSDVSWTYTQDDYTNSYALSITHNRYADLMIGSVAHLNDATGDRWSHVVAIDAYSHTEVWKAYIEEPINYGEAYWVENCSFYTLSITGVPLYQPDQFLAVYHEGEQFNFPQARYLHFLHAESGAEFGRYRLTDSYSSPRPTSVYEDDAVFYQVDAPSGPGANALVRHYVTNLMQGTSASVIAPTGYEWGSELQIVFAKRGNRFEGRDAIILGTVKNTSTSVYGAVVWNDADPGLGATNLNASMSVVDEYASASGQPIDAVYDSDNGCFWVLFEGGGNTQIAKVDEDGTILSETDWNTSFSITGAAAGGGKQLALDALTGRLWLVLGTTAYSWPTYDLTETPTAEGTGLSGDAIALHPGTSTLFQGDNNDPEYKQHRLAAVQGNGVSLQTIVENICDEDGTNMLTGDRVATALSGITVDGFAIQRIMERRKALQELTTAYLWDFVPRAGVLTAVLRGGSSAATLDDDDLGAHIPGGDIAPRITISRAAEEKLPKLVGVTFIDSDQNYEQGYEAATRQASAGGTDSRIQLGVVLSHDDASQLASILLHAAHIEAESYKTTAMPSQHSTVVPAAIITANIGGTLYPMRIDKASIVDGGIVEAEGFRHDASIYTDYSAGGTTRDRDRTVLVIGATLLYPLDLPALRDADFNAGVYLAANSYSPTWPGAEIYSSPDGIDYAAVSSVTSRTTLGYLNDTLPEAAGTDMANTLRVRLVSGSLSSIAHDTMQTDKTANLAAVGTAGRWEIIRFQTVSQDTDDTWTVNVLHRALRDTTDAADDHAAGDLFVLLDAATLGRAIVQTTDIGSTQYFKGVTIGANIADTAPQLLTPAGEALMPFRPASLHASLSGGTWTLSWHRQDKKQARLLQQPVNSEDSESYSVDILDLGGNVINTYTSSTESLSYTSAQQTADWGAAVEFLKWQVAQSSATVGLGPYQDHSSGTYSGDYEALVTGHADLIEYWPANETIGSTMNSDSGTHDGTWYSPTDYNEAAITIDGEPTVKTTGAGRFDVSGWATLANVQSVECWIKPDTLPSGDATILSHTSGTNGWVLYCTSAGQVKFRLIASSATVLQLDSNSNMVADGVYHIVCTFSQASGGSASLYVNGVEVATGTLSAAASLITSGQFSCGSAYWSGTSANMDRWHNKIALYSDVITAADIFDHAIAGFGP